MSSTGLKQGSTLARQLLTGFLAVIVPSTILLGGVTLYSLSSLDRVSRELVDITSSREAVTELRMTLTQVGAPLGSFVLTRDPANAQRFEELIRSAEAQVQSCATATCHGSRLHTARMAARLDPEIEQLKKVGRRIFTDGARGEAGQFQLVRDTLASVRSATEPMLEAVQVRGDELAREADVVRRRAWILTVSLTLAIMLAGVATAMVIAGRLARPLHDLLLGVRRVMAGDWNYRAESAPKGEIGELASAFSGMVQEIRERRSELEEHNRTLEGRVRQRTEELREKEQALIQSEKLASLGRLAAGVAHELNNPLTSIVMNANLVIEELGEHAPLSRELKKIDRDAVRCQRIIDDLRAFARVPQVERVLSDVDSVVEQALSSAVHELGRRNIHVRCDLAPDLPKIPWDPTRMVQVLTNLLVNAAQATGPGGHVVLRARKAEGWLRLEVEDDGEGIPPEHRKKIFEPFFTTKADGTGLGLSISHGIVNEHGGRIEMESRTRAEVEPGGRTGTTVRILLPLAEAAP
jgi:signal transduction histidine kinase